MDDLDERNLQHVITNQTSIPTKLLSDYRKLNLNEIELLILIQIHRYIQSGNRFPTPSELSSCLTINETACAKYLQSLVKRDLLAIEQQANDSAILTEVYDLTGLWKQLYSIDNSNAAPVKQTKEAETNQIFEQFQQEFARLLSPFEIELIGGWIDTDHYDISLIQAALREAVLLGKLNLKYIDRILREWQKKGIKTVDAAKKSSRDFRNSKTSGTNPGSPSTEKRDTSFYYNWLEGEE